MTAPCMPVEMPELRRHLMAKWATEPAWQAIERVGTKKVMGTYWSEKQLRASVLLQIEMVEKGDLYWVGEEMCDLLFGTADSVPDDVLGSDLTFPARCGFLVFSRTWNGLDAYDTNNSNVKVDAIAWIRTPTNMPISRNRIGADGTGRAAAVVGGSTELVDTLTIAFYRSIDWDGPPVEHELLLAKMMNAEADATRSVRIRSDGALGPVLTGRSWVPLGRSTWPINDRIDDPVTQANENIQEDGGDDRLVSIQQQLQEARSAVEDRRLIAALFTLLASHSIARVSETHPDRASMRREARAGGHKGAPSAVKVVYLRRPASEESGEGEHSGNYSHRWVVNSHWRNQPYGPGRAKRRLTLIGPYVKGPEDKPLVVKETVKAWVR